MLTTIEAEIDVNGNVRFLEPLKITKKSRALVTLLDDENLQNRQVDKPTHGLPKNDLQVISARSKAVMRGLPITKRLMLILLLNMAETCKTY